MIIFTILGFVGSIFQLVLLREFTFSIAKNELAFVLAIGIWLVSASVGSLVGIRKKLFSSPIYACILSGLFCFLIGLIHLCKSCMTLSYFEMASLSFVFVSALLVIGSMSFFIGYGFGYFNKIYLQKNPITSKTFANFFGYNAAGFFLGGACFTFFLSSYANPFLFAFLPLLFLPFCKKSLTEKLQKLDPIKLELSASVFFIKNYIMEQYWYDFWNKPLVNRVLSKFFKHISQKYKELRKEQKNEIIKYIINKNRLKKSFLESEDFIYVDQDINLKERQTSMTQNQNKTKKDLHKRIFRYGESLHQGIVGIYYICEIFPKKFMIKKTFFSGNELYYILDKHSQFFYTINKNLKDKDLIRYYGTVTRKKKSNEKIYIITEKGIKFTEEIIEIKRRDFPILFDELIATLEKRYIDYIVDLINSENKIIIRSQKDINDKLRKMAGDNNIELVTSYRSDRLDIEFHCKKCKKQFKDTYQLIESRKDSKLFCPYCFPELKTNIYLSEELKVQISKFVFNELRKTTIHKLSKNKILDIIEYIKKLVFNFVEPKIIEKKSEFKEFIEKYICSIVGFLTDVKRLSETNQFINLSEISLLFHDKSIVSESMWQAVCRTIIKYLREEFDFNIRTKRYDSLPESIRQSIRNYITLYKLILGVDRSGNMITYLDIDFKTEIKIYYDGKCQGINGYCPFDIDYKFLPALSFDHRLEKYNTIVKRKEMRYITPTKMLSGSFNGALTKMKSQIGGLDLRCRNCHSSRHHKMYNFLPIFNFLKSLHIRNIDVNTTLVLDSVNLLAKKYFEHTKKTMKLSEKNTQAQILGRIRSQIFRLIKKKYIIEYLFGANYICPICQKANINEYLTCFEAHHTNKNIFENDLQKIILSSYFFKSTKWLIKKLIDQECIYVCRNCHTMITAKNYNENALIILENEINALYIKNFYDNLNVKVNEIRDVIMHWKSELKNNMNFIPNPFLKMFDYGESIYSALICIYYVCEIFSQTTKKDFFTAEELNYIQKKSSSYFKQYKNNLIDLEYIQYEKRLLQYRGFGFNKDIYKITFEGILKAKEIIEERLEEFPDEFNELVSQWEYRSRKYKARKQRLSAFDVVLICVYFICNNKKKIEFFLNAFHYIIDKENSYFGKHRKKMLNLEYITENQETANSFKEISITPKGIKRAEELISLITRDYFEKYQKLISDWEKRYNEYLKTIENENKDPNYMHI